MSQVLPYCYPIRSHFGSSHSGSSRSGLSQCGSSRFSGRFDKLLAGQRPSPYAASMEDQTVSDFVIDVSMMTTGNTVAKLQVACDNNIAGLKYAIEEALGVPVKQQKLMVGNELLLDNTQMLKDTALASEPHVYLINIGVEGQLYEAGIASYSGQSVAEASKLGALGDVLRLVEAKADINSKDDYGYTALHHMAGVPGLKGSWFDEVNRGAAATMMKWLIDHGADVNSGDKGGKTPLHVLCKYGWTMDQLNILLEGGADVNQAMNYGDGWTPLWYCRYYKQPLWEDVEDVLVARGAEQVPQYL
jgi:hypothetical protein